MARARRLYICECTDTLYGQSAKRRFTVYAASQDEAVQQAKARCYSPYATCVCREAEQP